MNEEAGSRARGRFGWKAFSAGALALAGGLWIWRKRSFPAGSGAEAWYSQLVEGTPAYLFISSPDGNRVFLNRPMAKFLGTRQWNSADRLLRLVHPGDADQAIRNFRACLAARTDYFEEYRVRRSDGEYRWIVAQAQPSYRRGEFAGFTGALFDITERKAAEELALLRAELLEGQDETVKLIARQASLPQTLDSLLRAVEARFPEMYSSILLLDRDGLHLRHGAAPRLPEAYKRTLDGEPIGPSAGSCGTAAFRKEAVVVEDISSDPLWRDYRGIALQYGLRACWSTPVFDEQQRVLGTFALYFTTPRRPDESHWKLIHMVTHTAAIAIVRRREAEALWCSEERLRLAVTAGNIGIWDWDRTTDRLTWNDSLKTIFGRAPGAGDLTSLQFLEFVHPEDRPGIKAAIRDSLSHRTDHKAEFRIVRPDGSERWIAGMGRGEYDADANAVRMLGVAIDITEQKHADEEIKRREAQLVNAQRIARLGSYEWDPESNRVYRSLELCHIFGLEPDEFEPTFEGYLARVHPEDRKSTEETIERAFRDRTPFAMEERIVRGDGVVRIVFSQGNWVCGERGQSIRLVGTCQDITERKQNEERLQAAHAALAEQMEERTRTELQIRDLGSALINAQEEERTRIARELHDDLSQQIAAVSIALSNLKRGIPVNNGELREQSGQIQERLVRLAEGVRRLSHELHPAILQHAGLAAALKAYCSEVRELTGIEVAIETNGSFEQVSPAAALCVYRVAQEALRNIEKHAKVDHADVALSHSGGILRLTVKDRGVGFASQPEVVRDGLGLISIRERARLVNGAVEIQSRPSEGATVILTIPDPG